MVKKIGIALLCMALGTTIQAREMSESQKFIGVEVTISEVQGESPAEVEGSTSDGTAFGFRIGAQNEKWRTMFILNYFDAQGRNVEKLFLSVDYFFLKTDLYDSYALQPYMGVNMGYMNYESKNIDESGFLYGMQAGLALDVVENISLDLGYRYSLSSADALDHTGDVVFGVNYQY